MYEIAELIVFLPEGFCFSHMFDNLTNIQVQHKKTAISETNESFTGVTLLAPQRSSTSQVPMEVSVEEADGRQQADTEMPPTSLDPPSSSISPSQEVQPNQPELSQASQALTPS